MRLVDKNGFEGTGMDEIEMMANSLSYVVWCITKVMIKKKVERGTTELLFFVFPVIFLTSACYGKVWQNDRFLSRLTRLM